VLGLAILLSGAATAAQADGSDAPAATQVATISDPRISEASALVPSPTHPGVVWTVNDSGHTASVFGVSVTTGRTVAVLRLRDTDARDWESMTAQRSADGRGLLWIGDTGDNNAIRTSIVLRLVTEPTSLPKAGGTVDVAPLSLRVRYPDGPHDVEALVATRDGRLLLVTKELFTATVFQVPPDAVSRVLSGRSVTTPVTAVDVGGVGQSLVTDGASLPDGRIVLRDYVNAVVYDDRTKAGRGLQPVRRLVLPPEQQGEGLAVIDDGAALLVGSEGLRQPLWRVPLTAAASPGSATTAAPGQASTTDPATATATTGAPASEQVRRDGDEPAAHTASGGTAHDGLTWVLRVAALLLVPVAFLLPLRRRSRR
jgi:hypothetical protein